MLSAKAEAPAVEESYASQILGNVPTYIHPVSASSSTSSPSPWPICIANFTIIICVPVVSQVEIHLPYCSFLSVSSRPFLSVKLWWDQQPLESLSHSLNYNLVSCPWLQRQSMQEMALYRPCLSHLLLCCCSIFKDL